MTNQMRWRWGLWTLLVNRGHHTLAYWVYCGTISPWIVHTCKLRGARRISIRTVPHSVRTKVRGGSHLSGGTLCKPCHKRICGRAHKSKGFMACLAPLEAK